MYNYFDWFCRIPFFTRYWLTFTVVISVLARLNYLNTEYLILRHYPFFEEFHIWRPMTALFYFPICMLTHSQFIMNCYFVYEYSSRLESRIFSGRPAEYFTMLYFNWIVSSALGLILGIQYLMDPMVISVVYIWCRLNKDVETAFFFGNVRAIYLPWLMRALSLVVMKMNENEIFIHGMNELIGILVGHLGFFLMFKYPENSGGAALLSPPAFLKKILPDFRTIEPDSTTPTRTRHRRGYTNGGH